MKKFIATKGPVLPEGQPQQHHQLHSSVIGCDNDLLVFRQSYTLGFPVVSRDFFQNAMEDLRFALEVRRRYQKAVWLVQLRRP